jgi:hypothetical protein
MAFLTQRPRQILSGLLTSAMFVLQTPALAQTTPQCVPGTNLCYQNGKVVVQGQVPVPIPEVRVKTQAELDAEARARLDAEARARLDAEARVRLDAEARARLDAEARYADQQNAWRIQWDAYLRWRMEVKASVRAELYARAVAYAQTFPDPFLGVPSPISSTIVEEEDNTPSFRDVSIGLFAACSYHLSGSGAPLGAGTCPSLAFRIDESWTVHAEVSVTAMNQQARAGSVTSVFGMHPALSYNLLHRRYGEYSGLTVYARGGLDWQFPLINLSEHPGSYGGMHAGLGLLTTHNQMSFGLELRAITRLGLGQRDDGPAREASTFRAGGLLRATMNFEF